MDLLFRIPWRALAIAAVVVAPGLVAWWTGRALARNLDDPLIPERLLAARVRARYALLLSWVLIIAFASDLATWLIPIIIVCRALGAYPLRRALHGETWSALGYLWFYCRFTVAFFGFWLLLMFSPEITAAAGRAEWIAAIALAAVLLLWNDRSSDIVCFVMRTKPVADPMLAGRLAQVVERSDVAAPRIGVVPMDGGVLPNAVALPSLRRPTVLMTSTFVERFDPDEIAAVCGHELAHLEYYSGRRLRRLYFIGIVLVVTGVGVGPMLRMFAPEAPRWAFLCWIAFVFTFQALRARSRQKNETASDLRAVALTGDGEALVRALVRLHTMARVPRRWDVRIERNATHPSLARRVKAIREAAGHAPAPLDTEETFQSGTTSITIDRDRLHWTDSGLAHAVSYSRLVELRLDAGRGHPPRLVAVDRTGQRWTFALEAADVERAQRTLDVVDGQLAEAAPSSGISHTALRMIALTTAMIAASASQLAVLLPLALVLARPSAALAAGAAAAAVASGLVAVRDGLTVSSGWLWWGIALGASSVGLMTLAWFGRKDEANASIRMPVAALSVCTLFVWLVLPLAGTSAVRLHQSAQASPGAIVYPVALAVTLAWSRRAAVRRAATPILIIAMLIFGIGSRTYVESFARDRFIAQGPPLAIATLEGAPISEAEVPESVFVGSIRLSPDGRHLAIGSDDEDDERRVFFVGPSSGPFDPIECDEAFFVDAGRLLTVRYQRDAIVLREVSVEPEHDILRERRVERVKAARVAFNRPAGIWTVLGTGASDDVVRIEGRVGSDAPRGEKHWPRPAGVPNGTGWVQAIAASSERVLMRSSRYHTSPFGYRYATALAYALAPSWIESEFWIVGPAEARSLGTSSLTVDCHFTSGGDDQPVCAAFDGARSTLFSVDLESGTFDPKATMHGRFVGAEDDGGGGWSGTWDSQALSIRGDGAHAWRVRVGEGEWIRALAANDAGAAAIVSGSSRVVVRTYAKRPI